MCDEVQTQGEYFPPLLRSPPYFAIHDLDQTSRTVGSRNGNVGVGVGHIPTNVSRSLKDGAPGGNWECRWVSSHSSIKNPSAKPRKKFMIQEARPPVPAAFTPTTIQNDSTRPTNQQIPHFKTYHIPNTVLAPAEHSLKVDPIIFPFYDLMRGN